MKNILLFLIILLFSSCASTNNIAEDRNSDFAVHNDYEWFKIWRELDIQRFNNNILKVKIALIPEDKTIADFETNSQLISIFDSLDVIIKKKMNGFVDLKKSYDDTTVQGKSGIYTRLKSDSTDKEFLYEIRNNPYYDLYKEMLNRLRESIRSSDFYASRENFEDYIQTRSFEVLDKNDFQDIFKTDKVRLKNLSKDQLNKLNQNQVNFLISFSGIYNIDYSDRARGHIGSETIRLSLFDVQSKEIISTSNITHFWGSD